MIESMIITLREGIEAALVVGIIIAYLSKSGNNSLRRMVFIGLGASIVASIAMAFIFQSFGLNMENPYMEGSILAAAGIMVISLVIWMWHKAKNLKGEMEKKLDRIVQTGKTGTQGWGMLIFTFLMVFREGAETVLFLMSATLGKFSMLSLTGGVIGIAMAVLFAIFFIKGSLRINLPRFFSITSIVLLILAIKLLLGSIHEFEEVGAIALTPGLTRVIDAFVKEGVSTIILMTLLAIPLLVILWDTGGKQYGSKEIQEDAAEKRNRQIALRRERLWRVGLITVVVIIIIALGSTMMVSA